MGTNYRQLSLEERCSIALLYKAGQSVRQIAATLDRQPSTISREIKRNKGAGEYRAGYADEQRWARRWRGSKLERNPALQHYVIDRLVMGWSPEQIAGRAALEQHSITISYESIYRFVYTQYGRTKDPNWRLLLPRAKFKRGFRGRKGGSSTLYIKHRVSVHERPEHVHNRQQVGHWEADLMIFSKTKTNLLVMQERHSRLVKLSWQPDKTAARVAGTLKGWLSAMPSPMRGSLTQDNGTEFAQHYQLHELGMATYFCDPHSPWQKGGVENMNGRLRRYLPLKTHCQTVSDDDILLLENQLNTTPRKCLGYQTPLEIFNNQPLHFKRESTPRPAPG